MSERRARPDARRQLASLTPLLVAWVSAGAVLCAVAMQRSVPVETLFLDAAYLADRPWYTGVLSSVGILGWTAAVVAGLGGGWVAAQTGRPSAARFLRIGAAATTVLLADDLLELHAVLLEPTGTPKAVRQLLIVAPALAWLVRYRGEIARTRWVILFCGLAGFGTSLLIDVMGNDSSLSVFGEDGAKLLGVLAWAQYMVLTSLDITRSTIRAATAPAQAVGGAEDQAEATADMVAASTSRRSPPQGNGISTGTSTPAST